MWPTIKLKKGHEAWVVQLLFIKRNCGTCSHKKNKKKKKRVGEAKGKKGRGKLLYVSLEPCVKRKRGFREIIFQPRAR